MARKNNKEKLTWDMVFEDFTNKYPRLSKSVTRWYAYDVGIIRVDLIDGMTLNYDYDIHIANIVHD